MSNKANTLDITNLKETGADLIAAILQGVKDTQRTIIQDLPNELLITKAQFNMLQTQPEMYDMFASGEYFYRTPRNVMEVVVKGVPRVNRRLIETA